MPSKNQILAYVGDYDAATLAGYITGGVVTLDELMATGELAASVRQQIQSILQGNAGPSVPPPMPDPFPPMPDPQYDPWASVDTNDMNSLQQFVLTNPNHPKVDEANMHINRLYIEQMFASQVLTDDELKHKIESIYSNKALNNPVGATTELIVNLLAEKRINTQQIVTLLSRDHNALHIQTVKDLLDKYVISYMHLQQAGIPTQFINYMPRYSRMLPFMPPMRKLDRIEKTCSEFYFWGIPSSGKTCALAAILSTAHDSPIARSMVYNNGCQGYDYMVRLSQIFKGNDMSSVSTLPGGTPSMCFYEMGFDLIDREDRIHPITCIDLAGELILHMYKKDAMAHALTEDQADTLETVTNILKNNATRNRKHHFFVIEYGGHTRRYEGLDQAVLLEGAVRYIQNTGIFNKETDGIYILFTKADKTGLTGQPLLAELAAYRDRHYRNFYEGLRQIARSNEIKNGNVPCLPFSIGDVAMQDLCEFDADAAENVVRMLLENTVGFSQKKFTKLVNKFQG